MTFNAGIEAAAKWHDEQQQGGHCGESTSEIIVRQRCNGWHKYAATEIRSLTRPSSSAPVEPTVAQVNSACMSFRHDFGLLNESGQQQERFVALEWLRAWQKEGFAILSLPGSSRDEVLARARPSDCACPMSCGWHHVRTEPEINMWVCLNH
jgi:hypothetical protein